jgi:hypothetical protein
VAVATIQVERINWSPTDRREIEACSTTFEYSQGVVDLTLKPETEWYKEP